MPNIPDSRAPASAGFSLPDEKIDAVSDGLNSLSKTLGKKSVQKKIKKLFLGEPEDVIDSDEINESHLLEALEEKRQRRVWRRMERKSQADRQKNSSSGLLNGRAGNTILQAKTYRSRRD
ncbi:hypothetical protein [Kiloniella antarctica]|uniref:Uncharacterized protein n=1 Tax=Kiloniella antarctica TaxID=1550907 RepID=A0ABW5BHB1_9PROT